MGEVRGVVVRVGALGRREWGLAKEGGGNSEERVGNWSMG